MAVYAIDAGGTRIKLAVVEDGAVLARTTIDAFADEGLAAALPRMVPLLQAMQAGGQVTGIGIGFPSLVDTEKGKVVGDVGKYRDAENIDLNAWAREELGVPLAIENDARLAAIGEWQYGVGRGATDMVMMTLGTGIGTGVIMNGQVLRGKHGAAGCLGGHMTMVPNGRPCPCGSRGCYEMEASTAALLTLASKDPEFATSVLGNAKPLDYAAVFSAALLGDTCATRLRERALEVWGALAVSLVHAYDPEVLVLGGGIMASGEAILGPIRSYVHQNAWTPWAKVRVVASELGDDAALLACEWLLQNNFRSPSPFTGWFVSEKGEGRGEGWTA